MALDINLKNIKSAGVYTIEIDNTVRSYDESTALRLLVGFTGKGPFNRPVYIESEEAWQKIYGDADPKLEHKGCYFSRFASTMLRQGPIFALNLLNVDDTTASKDKVNFAAMSLNSAQPNPRMAKNAGKTYGEYDYLASTLDKSIYGTVENDVIPYVGAAPFASMYDRSRFWIPSQEMLMLSVADALETGDVTTFENTNFLNFANVGTEEFSIIVMKPENLIGYDITCAEWYNGSENIPYSFIRPYDYVSDYFLTVICVKGNWSNYPNLSTDPIWGSYFDGKGIIKAKLNSFLAAEGIELLGSWTGCIIPDFADKQGTRQDLVTKINRSTESTGLLAAFNEDAAQALAFDYNGADREEGQDGTGCWFLDSDENSQLETNNREFATDRFLVDMVGHNLKMADNKELGTSNILNVSDVNVSGNDVSIDISIPSGTPSAQNLKIDISTFTLTIDGNTSPSYTYDISTNSFINSSAGTSYALDSTTPGLTTSYASTDVKNNNVVNKITIGLSTDASIYKYNANGVKDGIALTPLFDTKTKSSYSGTKWLGNDGSIYTANGKGVNPKNITWEKLSDVSVVSNKVRVDGSTFMVSQSKEYAVKLSSEADPYKAATITKLTSTDKPVGIPFLSYNFIDVSTSGVVSKITGVKGLWEIKAKDEDGNAPAETDAPVFIVTNYAAAQNLKVGDLVQNIAFNNEAGKSQKYKCIPGLTRVVSKIFLPISPVALTSTNDADKKASVQAGAFTYKGKLYNFDFSVSDENDMPSIDENDIPNITDIIDDIPGGSNDTSADASLEVIYDKNFGQTGVYLYTTIEPVLIENGSITKQLPISSDTISHSLRWIPMKGLKLTSRHKPGYDKLGNISMEGGVEKIYSMLFEPGILRGLCNPEMVDYRYIVDSMGFGLGAELGGKKYLAALAKRRGKTTALLNLPSKKQFANAVNPYFCDSYISGVQVKPAFDTKYIPQGGNPELYSTSAFSLPSEDNGSKFCGCFWPWLEYTVSGKKIIVPPAADVSNVFINKFNGGDPYAICANLKGILSNPYITGIEYDADQYDRDYLEPFGVNTIIRRQGNVMIYGNQTAYQKVISDFNKLHVRETLNTIEIECDKILHNYNFEYNTPVLRAAVVTALTPVLQGAAASGAIDSNFSIICDETNNTDEIIERDMGIVDLAITMNHGMEKIIQRITVNRRATVENV